MILNISAIFQWNICTRRNQQICQCWWSLGVGCFWRATTHIPDDHVLSWPHDRRPIDWSKECQYCQISFAIHPKARLLWPLYTPSICHFIANFHNSCLSLLWNLITFEKSNLQKQCTSLESWMIQLSKNVRHFSVSLFGQTLIAFLYFQITVWESC